LVFGSWDLKGMFLCVDLDAFFVSVERVLNPSLIGKPVIVGGLPEERGVVASASYEARKFGIRSAMPTAQAYRLCPHAIFLKGNFKYYELYSERFYRILTSYSPEVDMVSIDEAYINIKGTQRLFGPPQILARRLKTKIRKNLNLPASIGIARTKVFSKIACEQSKPDGILFVQPGYEVKFLFPLKVKVLPGIGPKHLEILRNLNINTVEELMNTPDWVLETALGNYYKIIKFFVYGGDYQFSDGVKSVSRETTLPQDTINKEFIYALFLYLIERVSNTLREKRLLAKILTIKVRFSDFKTVSKRARMPANNAQQMIFEHGIQTLQNLLEEKKRVRLIGVALSGFEYDGLQPSIFKVKEERLNQVNSALDKARGKFGFNALYPASAFILRNKNFK
jgi:DNA polymerase-4